MDLHHFCHFFPPEMLKHVLFPAYERENHKNKRQNGITWFQSLPGWKCGIWLQSTSLPERSWFLYLLLIDFCALNTKIFGNSFFILWLFYFFEFRFLPYRKMTFSATHCFLDVDQVEKSVFLKIKNNRIMNNVSVINLLYGLWQSMQLSTKNSIAQSACQKGKVNKKF